MLARLLFAGGGLVALALPTDFNRIGSAVCATANSRKLLICPKLRIRPKEEGAEDNLLHTEENCSRLIPPNAGYVLG